MKGVPRTGLEPACLSTHAPETCASTNSATWAYSSIAGKTSVHSFHSFAVSLFFVYSIEATVIGGVTRLQKESGRRNSNPRPQPWQGCALPTELLPLMFFFVSLSRLTGAKIEPFSKRPNVLRLFFLANSEANRWRSGLSYLF